MFYVPLMFFDVQLSTLVFISLYCFFVAENWSKTSLYQRPYPVSCFLVLLQVSVIVIWTQWSLLFCLLQRAKLNAWRLLGRPRSVMRQPCRFTPWRWQHPPLQCCGGVRQPSPVPSPPPRPSLMSSPLSGVRTAGLSPHPHTVGVTLFNLSRWLLRCSFYIQGQLIYLPKF